MPAPKKTLPSSANVPLRRASPRLLEKKKKQYSHATATRTAAVASTTTGQNRSSGIIVKNNIPHPLGNKKPANLPIISRQRGKDIGNIVGRVAEGENHNPKKSGNTDVGRRLHVDLEKEDGSDTDSFVSTLGFLKDADDENSEEDEKLHEDDRYNDKGEGEEENGNSDDEDDEDNEGVYDDDNGTSGDMSPVLLVGKKNTHNTVRRDSGVGKNETKLKIKTRRSTNYTELEDVLITKAFVSVSEDPINGSQQRANIFWAKVHQKYKVLIAQQEKNKQPEIRSVDSIKQRYTKTIAKETGKFNKFYILLKKQNKSGWTEDNYMEEAGILYEEEYNKPFNFTECLFVLHNHPKFDPMTSTEEANNRSKRVNNTRPPQGAAIPRPIGTKKAKIVQYLKDSGVVVGQPSNDYSSAVESSSVTVNAGNSEITRRLDRNYRQRERQMKLNRIDLYLKMNDIEKAKELMKEVEEETANEECGERITLPSSTPHEGNKHVLSSPDLDERNPPMPPLNEVVVGEEVVNSQLTNTQI